MDDIRWLTVDPGEDTGYSIWQGSKLIDAGTEKMWPFADAVSDGISGLAAVEDTAHISGKLFGVSLIVCEEWAIYPWEARKGSLDWDKCRTARLIGALTFLARSNGIEFVLQPAKIKERAQAAGVEALYLTPLHENRHANDALQHAVYYMAVKSGAAAVDAAVSQFDG